MTSETGEVGDPNQARRWLIVGSSGSGKSTLARKMGEILGLEVIHLDRNFWNSGWVETERPEWRKKVGELIEGDAWIMGGDYSGTIDIRLPRAQTAVLLDFPMWRCVWRVYKRSTIYRGATRPDLPEGCPEQLPDRQFLWFVVSYPWRSRPKVLRLIAERPHVSLVRLRSDREVEGFLEELARSQP